MTRPMYAIGWLGHDPEGAAWLTVPGSVLRITHYDYPTLEAARAAAAAKQATHSEPDSPFVARQVLKFGRAFFRVVTPEDDLIPNAHTHLPRDLAT